ncbi:MAG TPA: class I SAM-dependent methyltransferase [Acidimicrobiales bacterium]|nr:class I SAM-dependent methyltransferase [Acidimicrobiales bacterium]
MTTSARRELEANRASWDERVPIHVRSAFYDVEGWLRDRPGPRKWEQAVIGDVAGLDVVHLQCHFGLDTLALAAAGATVTGLDFSPNAVDTARSLAERAGLADRARFVEGNVLDAAAVLAPATFDLVFVSLGALCWLPSVDRWAAQVAALLRPGGRLFLHDGHPLAWAMADDEMRLEHTYFEETDPFVDESSQTYTDGGDELRAGPTYEWNHSIGETVNAVIRHGLGVDRLDEHDWTVWPRFPWLVRADDGRWVTPPDRPRVPLTFTLVASRRDGAPPRSPR